MGKLGRNKLLCLVKGHDTEERLEEHQHPRHSHTQIQ
jgi:hypothetical protein